MLLASGALIYGVGYSWLGTKGVEFLAGVYTLQERYNFFAGLSSCLDNLNIVKLDSGLPIFNGTLVRRIGRSG